MNIHEKDAFGFIFNCNKFISERFEDARRRDTTYADIGKILHPKFQQQPPTVVASEEKLGSRPIHLMGLATNTMMHNGRQYVCTFKNILRLMCKRENV